MLTDAKKVVAVISDLHLGEGVDSPIEDFKHHEPGNRIDDADSDYTLDNHFAAFLKWLTDACQGKELCLILNGDTFDPLAVRLRGEYVTLPYENADVRKFQKIARGHPEFFSALKEFLAHQNHELLFIRGNHDIFLDWPKVRAALLEKISPNHPNRVRFGWEEVCGGIYIRHGEAEPHDRINHKKVIITRADLAKLFKPKEWEKMLRSGELPSEDVLDVPLGHYLTADLENPLRVHNYLIARMHVHGFVWSDAFRNIGRRSWYRSRWFGLIAAYHLIKTILKHSLFGFWHLKMKSGPRRILKVVWWTIVGFLEGATTRDLALKILKEREDVDVVVMGHEHQYCVEMHQIGSRATTYVNTGAWNEQWEAKKDPAEKSWKYFDWLRRFGAFWRKFYQDAEMVPHLTCPTLVISWNAAGERTVRLMRFDYEEKTLKKL